MAKIRLQRRSSSTVLHLFGALGLVLAVGCGDSETTPKKDGGPGPEAGPATDALIKTDVIQPTIDTRLPVDVQLGPDVQPPPIEAGPVIDVRPTTDLPPDRPATGGAGGSIDGGAGGRTGTGGRTGIDGGVGGSTGTGTGGRTGAGGAISIDGGVGGATTAAGGATTAAGGATTAAGGATTAAGGATTAAGGSTTAAGGATTATGGSTAGVGGSTGGGQGGSTTTLVPVLTGWPTAALSTAITCQNQQPAATFTFAIPLHNTGDGVAQITGLSWASSTGYAVAGLAVGSTIAADVTTALTILGPANPTPGLSSNVLTVTTNEAAPNNSHAITVNETVWGSVLGWGGNGGHSNILNEFAPGNSSEPLTFTITNSGNMAVSVDLSSTPGTAEGFSLSCADGGNTCAAVSVPASGNVGASTTFTAPAEAGTYETVIALAAGTDNHLCQAVPGSWPVSATSRVGVPTFSPTNPLVDFVGNCGENPNPVVQYITITNSTETSTDYFLWKTNAATLTAFTITAPGVTDLNDWTSLGLGQSVVLAVTPQTLPFSATDTTGVVPPQALVISYLNAVGGTGAATYNLTTTPLGDDLTFAPGSIGFPQSILTYPAQPQVQKYLTITNNANAASPDATVNLSISASGTAWFSFDSGDVSTLTKQVSVEPAGGQQIVSVWYRRPAGAYPPNMYPYNGDGQDIAAILWDVNGDATCMCNISVTLDAQAAPPPCGTSGTATYLSGDVIAGAVGVFRGPDPIDSWNFGDIFCGATATAMTLTVRNMGDAMFTIRNDLAALGSEDHFTLIKANSSEQELEPLASTTFTIVPGIMPSALGTVQTTLTIPTTAIDTITGDPIVKYIPLSMTAKGIVIDGLSTLAWTYPTISWWTGVSSSAIYPEISTAGNAEAIVRLLGAPDTNDITLFPSPTYLPGSTDTNLTSRFGTFDDCRLTENVNHPDDAAVLQITPNLGGDMAPQDLSTSPTVGLCQTSAIVTGASLGAVPVSQCNPGITTATQCGAWNASLVLNATLTNTQQMCGTGQTCNQTTGACGCDPSTCSGCCYGGTGPGSYCLTDGTSQTACGSGGETCDTCNSYFNTCRFDGGDYTCCHQNFGGSWSCDETP